MSGTRELPLRVVVLTAFVVTGLVVAGIGGLAARESAKPAVVLLGAGGAVSALVTSGSARLLIATGDDPAAFAAALEAARQPVQRRIDVALVAGRGDELLVPELVLRDPHVRLAAALGDIGPLPGGIVASDLAVVTAPRAFDLGGLIVTVEAAPSAADRAAGEDRGAWQAVVSRGATRVVLLSDGDAARSFPPVAGVSLVVVVGRDPLAAIAGGGSAPAPALGFADGALAPAEMRAVAGGLGVSWAVRVFDGEPIVVEFTGGGLVLPPDAAVALGPDAGSAEP